MEILTVYLAMSLGITLFAIWGKWQWSRQHLYNWAAKIPGPPTLPILGNALVFTVGADKMLDAISKLRQYGPVIRLWLGPELNVMVTEPKDVEALLMSTRILHKGPTYKYMQQLIGQGLLSGSGPTWRNHRKIVNPAFNSSRMDIFLNCFNRNTTSLLDRLRNRQPGEHFNIFNEIIEATTDSVFETLLGYKKNNKELPHRDEIVRISQRIYEVVHMRMTIWWLQIEWIFRQTHLYKEQKYHMALCRTFSKAILADRMEESEKISELEEIDLTPFDRLLKEANMTKKETLDELFTLFTRSQEASATITSFTLLMLGMHQDYQEKVYNEVIAIIGKENRDVTMSEINSMSYLDMAVKEVLRLFPIGSILQRKVLEDIEISSCTLPAGCSLLIPVYQIHRDPKYWDEPDSFKPERFLPENSANRRGAAYLPFSIGPMNCVGQKFANLIIRTICCRVVREFRIHSKETMSELKLKTDVSVRPVNGYYVTLEPRE